MSVSFLNPLLFIFPVRQLFFFFLFYQDHPLMKILKRDLAKVFQDHKMIAAVQNNGSNAEDMLILRNRLYKHGITVKFFPNQVMMKQFLYFLWLEFPVQAFHLTPSL